MKRGEIVVIENVEDDPRSRETADRYLALGIRTMINVPVMERGRLVGVGFVHYAQGHSFRPKELSFVQTVTDRVQVAVARVQAEQQRVLLNGELSHRLKNTLAMVQGIAGQTLRTVPDQTPVQAFTERLIALSRAHDVLMQDSWAAAPILSVIERVLALQTALDRFRIEGPSLSLAPQATLSLSLLLHELTTNAVKYGALSVEGGSVHVAWRIEVGEEKNGSPDLAGTRGTSCRRADPARLWGAANSGGSRGNARHACGLLHHGSGRGVPRAHLPSGGIVIGADAGPRRRIL